MGRIQSNIGLITGVPIEDTVNQLMQLNSLARTRLAARNKALSNEQGAITALTTLVVGMQLTTDRLGQASLFSSTSVSSSKSDLISARSTGTPGLGSYNFVPIRQAQSQQLTSSLVPSASHKLSPGELTIHSGGFLDESVSLDLLNGGAGVARGFIRVTDRSGATKDVDLRFAQNANDVVNAINSTDGLSVVAKVQDGRFVLTDVSASTTSNLSVQEVGSGTTARDLGLSEISTNTNTAEGGYVYYLSNNSLLRNLLDSRGLNLPAEGNALQLLLHDGSQINFSTDLDTRSASLGQLLSELNSAGQGKIEARIASDGRSIEINDLTSGSGEFSISSPSGNLAEQLGFPSEINGNMATSARLLSGLSDTLLSSFRGGSGLGELSNITITDRQGNSDTIDLSSADTLRDVIDTLNSGANNASFRVQLNRTKTGLEVIDTSGGSGSLQIANADSSNSATKLGIETSVSSGSIDSGSLERQYINHGTSLESFLGGASLSKSSFQITDSNGLSATFNVQARDPKTIGDVIDGINSLGLGVTAKINDAGDGFVLVDTAGGSQDLTVQDVGSGNAAKQLRILGTASDIQDDGQTVSGINGSKTIRIATTAETDLSALVTEINQREGGSISASIINLGSSGVRLQLSGRQTGAQNRIAIGSTTGIDFTQTAEARDALISFGASEAGGGIVVSSSTDTFSGLVDGLEITVKGTSTSPVTVQVSENSDDLTKQIEQFVNQYNTLRDKFTELTSFNADTNEVGMLFGSNVALRTEMSLSRLVSNTIRSGTGNTIRSLPEIGVSLNESGKLSFDKEAFSKALAENPDAIRDFFLNETDGFSKKAKEVSDSLAGVKNGALLARNNTLQQTIDQNTTRISAMDLRLERQRQRLLLQFYGMEQAIAKLQTNLTAVNQIQAVPSV